MKHTTRLRAARTAVHSFFLLAAVLALGSCGMPFDWSLDVQADFDTRDSQAIHISGEQFTLSWDAPETAVSEYRLYQRPRGASGWALLVAGLPSPEATITAAQLDYGNYEFAVSTVNADGAESDLHTSLDETADPGSGWYLKWSAPGETS